MPDGLTLGAFVLPVVLLYLWHAQTVADDRNDAIDARHDWNRWALGIVDRCEETNYRELLRFDVGVDEILRDAA